MRTKGTLWEELKLLHPKNLQKEVHVYGYHFAWKAHIALIAGALAGISAVGLMFRLKPVYFLVITAAVVLVLPVLVLDMYKKMYEQKRFADVSSYMEQMLYSFQKSGKVVGALKETRELFDEGQMRRCIEEAIVHLELGKPSSDRGVLRESLDAVGMRYGCKKLAVVHNLLANSEEFGGETEDSIVLVLEDIEQWRKRGYHLQAEKKKSHTDNMISIAVATLLCVTALYVLDAMKQMFAVTGGGSIFEIPVIQVSSMLFLLVLLHIFVKSERSLTDNWLEDLTLHEEAYILRSYERVMDENAGKIKKSVLLSAAILAVPAFFLLLHEKWISGMICILIIVFLLAWKRMSYQLAKKDVTEEMYLALPQWLLGMALLLQNNNVQVALAKSVEGAPPVLQRELAALTARLGLLPGRLQSYTAFCGSFDLPEVTSCMKMLHAFSENGTGNVRVQMNHLLERVVQMEDRADKIRNDSTAFRMKMIFSYPVIAATVKLLLDLTVGMVVMMQVLGRIGGV